MAIWEYYGKEIRGTLVPRLAILSILSAKYWNIDLLEGIPMLYMPLAWSNPNFVPCPPLKRTTATCKSNVVIKGLLNSVYYIFL